MKLRQAVGGTARGGIAATKTLGCALLTAVVCSRLDPSGRSGLAQAAAALLLLLQHASTGAQLRGLCRRSAGLQLCHVLTHPCLVGQPNMDAAALDALDGAVQHLERSLDAGILLGGGPPAADVWRRLVRELLPALSASAEAWLAAGEQQVPLKGARLQAARALATRACGSPACPALAAPSESEERGKLCSGCGMTRFCSPGCLRVAWKEGRRLRRAQKRLRGAQGQARCLRQCEHTLCSRLCVCACCCLHLKD